MHRNLLVKRSLCWLDKDEDDCRYMNFVHHKWFANVKRNRTRNVEQANAHHDTNQGNDTVTQRPELKHDESV